MNRESIALHPHSYFRTKAITSHGDRDKRGRFIKAEIILKACSREEAEYMTGFMPVQGSFGLARMENSP